MTTAPNYFEVFKIGLIKGRTFNDQDTESSTPVVIINEAMAKQFWKTGDPLNDKLTIARGGMKDFAGEPDRQIIGVVANSRDNGLNQDPQPKMFTPQSQVPNSVNAMNVKITPMAWVIRTSVPPMSVNAAVQEQLRQATGLPVSDVRTMDQWVSRSLAQARFNSLLLATFAALALLLAAIGIYGVMSYAVSQRTSEIGIRLAMGAAMRDILALIIGDAMRLAGIGLAIGVVLALVLSRTLATLLYQVTGTDPLTFAAVVGVLAGVALVASYLPARRAARIPPVEALRYQ